MGRVEARRAEEERGVQARAWLLREEEERGSCSSVRRCGDRSWEGRRRGGGRNTSAVIPSFLNGLRDADGRPGAGQTDECDGRRCVCVRVCHIMWNTLYALW